MSTEETQVDWLRGTVEEGGKSYRVPASEQARALELLNARLLSTCAEQHLTCVDLEKLIPRSLEYFYDSVHFNESGAASVARLVAAAVSEDLNAQLQQGPDVTQ